MTDPEKLARPESQELNSVLGIPFRVLDSGFVRVIDYMGGDASIVQAARVSYGAGTKRARDDRSLLRYLMRHQHTTPFEMCEIKFHVRVPMDAWRQWIRHRTASVNEYSTRYSVAIASAQRTSPDSWRLQDSDSKQGSSGLLDLTEGQSLSQEESEIQDAARRVYEDRLAAGVAREQARKDLPLSTYTEAYWKIDLHNLLHFLVLRMAPNAQAEIRSYALIIGHEIVRRWCPEAWSAFLDYRLNGLHLSATEAAIAAADHTRCAICKPSTWLRSPFTPHLLRRCCRHGRYGRRQRLSRSRQEVASNAPHPMATRAHARACPPSCWRHSAPLGWRCD